MKPNKKTIFIHALVSLLMLGFMMNIVYADEWENPTIDLKYTKHGNNIFDYEESYDITLQRCIKKNFCVGYSYSNTTSSTFPDEYFNKVYIKKRWTIKWR